MEKIIPIYKFHYFVKSLNNKASLLLDNTLKNQSYTLKSKLVGNEAL